MSIRQVLRQKSFPESSGLPKYNELGQNQLIVKKSIILIRSDFEQIVSFTERGSLTDRSTVPLPMSNSSWSWRNSTRSLSDQNSLYGGPNDEFSEKFWQIEKKIIDLYVIRQFKSKKGSGICTKNFQNRDSKCPIFRNGFRDSESANHFVSDRAKSPTCGLPKPQGSLK